MSTLATFKKLSFVYKAMNPETPVRFTHVEVFENAVRLVADAYNGKKDYLMFSHAETKLNQNELLGVKLAQRDAAVKKRAEEIAQREAEFQKFNQAFTADISRPQRISNFLKTDEGVALIDSLPKDQGLAEQSAALVEGLKAQGIW